MVKKKEIKFATEKEFQSHKSKQLTVNILFSAISVALLIFFAILNFNIQDLRDKNDHLLNTAKSMGDSIIVNQGVLLRLGYECVEYSEMWTFKTKQGKGTIHFPMTVNGTPKICQNGSCRNATMKKTCIKHNVVKK